MCVGNPVQAYLDTLSLAQVQNLMENVDRALEQCEDSSRHMSAYQGGDKLFQRVREQCFTQDGKPHKPHKLDDMSKKLHFRLGCHKLHSIPIGFYYAKWSEKLHFHLSKFGVRKASRHERSPRRHRGRELQRLHPFQCVARVLLLSHQLLHPYRRQRTHHHNYRR